MSTEKQTPDEIIAYLQSREPEEPIARYLGMRLVELTPGRALVSMTMKPEYINFNGMVFGGIIMAAADQAFAYATNSLLMPNLAIQFNIHLIAGAAAGDELTAECNVVKSGRRISVSEMTVTNQDGRLIARASGTTMHTG